METPHLLTSSLFNTHYNEDLLFKKVVFHPGMEFTQPQMYSGFLQNSREVFVTESVVRLNIAKT